MRHARAMSTAVKIKIAIRIRDSASVSRALKAQGAISVDKAIMDSRRRDAKVSECEIIERLSQQLNHFVPFSHHKSNTHQNAACVTAQQRFAIK